MPTEIHILSIITRVAYGGSERRLHDVFRAMPEAHHTVVVGRDSDPRAVEELASQVEVVRSPHLVRAVDPRADLRAIRQIHQLIRAGHFDVVHTHHAKSGVVGRLAARAAGVPIVYHSASGASFGPSYGRLQGTGMALAERVTAPLVSRYFVVGHDLAAQLAANGISRRRLEVLRSSLELAPFGHDGGPQWARRRAAWRQEQDVGPDELVVCYVGRLDEFKGVRGLPDLVDRASRERAPGGPPVVLVLAGTGPLEDELRAEVEGRAVAGATQPVESATGPVRVKLLGHVASVSEVMAGADVLVLPSPKEGLPQVLVQAAVSGLPFVVYAVHGVTELLARGANGRVVPLGDRAAFATALAEELTAAAGRPSRPAPDQSRWSEWDPDEVARRYRARYELDLAQTIGARRRR